MDSYLAPSENGSTTATREVRDMRPEAARQRLRECKDQGNACEAIREIVSNLLGCEEMALFAVNRKEGRLALLWSFGIEPKELRLPQSLDDAALCDVLAGHVRIPGPGSVEKTGFATRVSAFVPVRFKGETAAVLVLLRLLPQKLHLDELDRELLAVISSEGGSPLFGGKAAGASRRERKR